MMPALDYIPLSATASRPIATAELRTLAGERMRALGYAYVGTELAPAGAGVRFDVVGVSRYTRQVRIYEVKSSRADFLSDAKWERYLPFCTHFAFVAPAGAIFRWELPRECGLIEYGAPAFERMRRARRFGLTILREDCLRAVRPSQRLRERVGDDQWIALLETMTFGARGGAPAIEFEDGAGI
jgi:hypothetical protein